MSESDLGKRGRELFSADAAGLRTGGDAPPAAVGASTNWRTMQDQQARDEWSALRDWVEWVTVRYNIPLVTVPTCWWQHPALVEELSALHCAHRAAFDPRDTGNGPVIWHEHFAAALPRLSRAYSGGCSTEHRSLRPRSWSGATNEDEWAAWINQSHAH